MGEIAVWTPEYLPFLSISWHVPSDRELNLASSAILSFVNSDPKSRFHTMLQHIWNFYDPASWQRLVCALLQDQTVWASIMNNQTFQELQGRLFTVNAPAIQGPFPKTGSNDQGEPAGFSEFIIRWVLDNATTIIWELINKLGSIFANVVQPTVDKTGLVPNDQFKAALMISLIITMFVSMAFRTFFESRDQNRT